LYIRHPDLWKELKEMEKISPHGWNMPGRTTSELEERFEKEIEFGEINLEDYK
jgi:peptidoglycan/xylan/chitin deacetylase (PgdA/CDA1 family)